jgi:hypothetical protein
MTRGQAEQFRDEVRRLSDNDAAEYIMRRVAAFEAVVASRERAKTAARAEQAVQDFIAGVLA